MTIVFDATGAPPGLPRTVSHHEMTVHFAPRNSNADEMIEELLEDWQSPKKLIVVSSDHRLQTAAQRKGAHFLGCTEFLDHLERSRQANPTPIADEPEKQDRLSEKEIHDWLQEFAGLEDEPDLKEAFERFDFEIE